MTDRIDHNYGEFEFDSTAKIVIDQAEFVLAESAGFVRDEIEKHSDLLRRTKNLLPIPITMLAASWALKMAVKPEATSVFSAALDGCRLLAGY